MRWFAYLAILALLTAPALAKGPPAGKGKGKGGGPGAVTSVIKGNKVGTKDLIKAFTYSDRRTIQSFFARGGVVGKPLPPGLAKQLRRNGRLPPGLQKKALPGDLAALLPGLPPGHRYAAVGNDVVLIEQATGLILDIMRASSR
jgi:hypothetical protein